MTDTLSIPDMDGLNIPEHLTNPARRHDFILVFEANNANPNGDPDMDNMPRTEPDQGRGLATDTSIKRKVRDIAAMLGHPIFIEPSQTLNSKISAEFPNVPQTNLTEAELDNDALIDALEQLETFDLDGTILRYTSDDPRKLKNEITELLPKGKGAGEDAAKLRTALQAIASRMKGNSNAMTDDRTHANERLVKKYYDIRMFGAVLSAGLNAGQVLGPVTLAPARTVAPVTLMQLSITRNAKNTAKRAEAGQTEMGRRHIVSHGLYVANGHYDPMLGQRLGVSRDDLHLLWYALATSHMHTRSAARSDINVRGLYAFTHEHALGNAMAHKLFEQVHILPTTESPLSYTDYTVTLPQDQPDGKIRFTAITHG